MVQVSIPQEVYFRYQREHDGDVDATNDHIRDVVEENAPEEGS